MVEMTYTADIQRVSCLNLPWEKLDGCNILITGATGLIGSCLVEVLMERQNRSYSVFALGRNKNRMTQLFSRYSNDRSFHILLHDVTEPLTTIDDYHFIIHAASGAAPNEFTSHPVEVMKANIQGVINLMEYGINHGLKRFLYISSGEVYGEGDGRVFSEQYSGFVDSMKSRSCYPCSKRAAETLCVSYANEYSLDVVVARPCHVYGPHFSNNDNRVYAQFIRNVLQGENIVMKSGGEQFRSWCYIVDCVSALLYILLKGSSGEAYNIADNESNTTIRSLAETLAELGGVKVVYASASDEDVKGYNTVKKSVFSTVKVNDLGWVPCTHIEEGFYKTLMELNSNLELNR